MPPPAIACISCRHAHPPPVTMATTMSEFAVYSRLQQLRLLARRDSTTRSPQVDKDLETFRLQFLEAFEAWMDGMKQLDLTPFIVASDRIITSNRELLRWLQRELEQDTEY